MECISQPFMAPCCQGYRQGDLVLTCLVLSDLPYKFLVESHIGRLLQGSEVNVTSYLALLAPLAQCLPLRSPFALRNKRGNKIHNSCRGFPQSGGVWLGSESAVWTRFSFLTMVA